MAISCWPRHFRTTSSPEDSDAYRNVRLPSRGNGDTMVAVRDFSGLAIAACALARGAANAPTLGLDCCMIGQIKAARALLDWSQDQLAAAADISIPTIKRLEANDGPLGGRGLTVERILTSLEAA